VVKAKTMYYAVYHFGQRWRLDGRTLRDETPLPPSAREAAAIEAWFQTHDVSDTQIPMLQIPTLEIH
jgi:hypothetical protein